MLRRKNRKLAAEIIALRMVVRLLLIRTATEPGGAVWLDATKQALEKELAPRYGDSPDTIRTKARILAAVQTMLPTGRIPSP